MGCLFLTDPRNPIFYFSMLGVENHWTYLLWPLELLGVVLTFSNCIPYITLILSTLFAGNFWMNRMHPPAELILNIFKVVLSLVRYVSK